MTVELQTLGPWLLCLHLPSQGDYGNSPVIHWDDQARTDWAGTLLPTNQI